MVGPSLSPLGAEVLSLPLELDLSPPLLGEAECQLPLSLPFFPPSFLVGVADFQLGVSAAPSLPPAARPFLPFLSASSLTSSSAPSAWLLQVRPPPLKLTSPAAFTLARSRGRRVGEEGERTVEYRWTASL